MYYRLSNIATRQEIEEEFQVPFYHPYLFQPQAVIDGLKETPLPIIASENAGGISFGIWGILPESYSGKWKKFQQIKNTLVLDSEIWDCPSSPFHFSLEKRRCLIITTGFFIYRMENNKVLPSFIYLPGQVPFCIAGIYNRLSDGFITCSMLTSSRQTIPHLNILDAHLPVLITQKMRERWLDPKSNPDKLRNIVNDNNLLRDNQQFQIYNFHKSRIAISDLKNISISKTISFD